MSEFNENEKRFTRSSIKIITNLILVLVVIVILILFNFFILDDFSNGQRNLIWWISKFLTGLGTFLIMIGLANPTEESLKMKNESYRKKIKSLDEHYNLVMQNGESEIISQFLLNINKKSK